MTELTIETLKKLDEQIDNELKIKKTLDLESFALLFQCINADDNMLKARMTVPVPTELDKCKRKITPYIHPDKYTDHNPDGFLKVLLENLIKKVHKQSVRESAEFAQKNESDNDTLWATFYEDMKQAKDAYKVVSWDESTQVEDRTVYLKHENGTLFFILNTPYDGTVSKSISHVDLKIYKYKLMELVDSINKKALDDGMPDNIRQKILQYLYEKNYLLIHPLTKILVENRDTFEEIMKYRKRPRDEVNIYLRDIVSMPLDILGKVVEKYKRDREFTLNEAVYCMCGASGLPRFAELSSEIERNKRYSELVSDFSELKKRYQNGALFSKNEADDVALVDVSSSIDATHLQQPSAASSEVFKSKVDDCLVTPDLPVEHEQEVSIFNVLTEAAKAEVVQAPSANDIVNDKHSVMPSASLDNESGDHEDTEAVQVLHSGESAVDPQLSDQRQRRMTLLSRQIDKLTGTTYRAEDVTLKDSKIQALRALQQLISVSHDMGNTIAGWKDALSSFVSQGKTLTHYELIGVQRRVGVSGLFRPKKTRSQDFIDELERSMTSKVTPSSS